jgi:hypothetical protein
VPTIDRGGPAFAIRLDDIPQPYRTTFEVALYGSGGPSIEAGSPCA